MSRAISLIIILLVAAAAYIWFVPGPSIVMGGPSKSEIEAVTRESLAGNPGTSSMLDVATITPQGLCNKGDDGSFTCAVEVEAAGAVENFVTTLRKDADGNWVAEE